MEMKRLYVDLHIIQTVPPSCLNRDDTGSPKTATYGGVSRARVSSQAWKHSMRQYFRELFPQGSVGVRTKKLVRMVAEEIEKLDSELDGEKLALDALKAIGLKINKKKQECEALFFISQAQARGLARLAAEQEKDKKKYKAVLMREPGWDMALFGRMVASDADLNYDAASQVAHSISTHAVHTEYDYFTAVDDLASEDTSGASHLGTVEFHSATLYRYATVNVTELEQMLGDDTAAAVRGFAEAFIRAMPEGRRNTFANLTRPDAVYVTVRRDQPVNLCGAFEEPVKSRDGYAGKSVERLLRYAEESYRDYVEKPAREFAVGELLRDKLETMPVSALLEKLEQAVAEELSQGEKR